MKIYDECFIKMSGIPLKLTQGKTYSFRALKRVDNAHKLDIVLFRLSDRNLFFLSGEGI